MLRQSKILPTVFDHKDLFLGDSWEFFGASDLLNCDDCIFMFVPASESVGDYITLSGFLISSVTEKHSSNDL